MSISDALPASGLVRVIYASRWTDATAVALDETVRQVLAKSIHNNRLCDVTGLLLVHDGWFVQALEGPAKSVGDTYDRIAADSRHGDLALLAAGDAERREFTDWNMSERRLAIGDEQLISEAATDGAFDPRGLSAEQSLALLRKVGAAYAA